MANSHHTNNTGINTKEIALDFLRKVRDDLTKAQRTRDHYIRIGHREGLTWEQMGEALGVTGAAVRLRWNRTLSKNGEENHG